MSRRLALIIATSLILLPLLAENSSAQTRTLDGTSYAYRQGAWYILAGPQEFRVNEDVLTARFAPSVSAEAIPGILAENGLQEIRHNKLGYYDLRVLDGRISFEAAHALAADPRVAQAFPASYGRYVTDDPSFSSQWNMNNTGSGGGTPDADIDAPEAWAIETGDPSIIIAPLDSGVDYHHNDLGPNLWQNLGEDADHDGQTLVYIGGQWVFDSGDLNGVDDDGNGMKDDLIGWDSVNNSNDVMDVMGHGTHVSGIVGARTNNATNVAGVAGGWGAQPGCSIMMVQVGDYSPVSEILDDAILYAVDNGARVITMSLSVYQSSAIDDALLYAHNHGVFVDCAAGNTYGGAVSYPATNPYVAAVTSTDRNDQFSYFSAQGPEVEIAAPGDDVTSTLPGQTQGSMSGTSMAAPHVAGAAGIVLSAAPWLDGDGVLFVLTSTADDKGTAGWDNYYGWGRLNLYNAVSLVAGMDMLKPDAITIDSAAGGTIHFTLEAGAPCANRPYLLLASLSGTSPGTPVGGTTLPLNWDALTDLSLLLVNTPLLSQTLGYLDGTGHGEASLNAPADLLRPAAGMVMHFAYLVGYPLDTASNAAPLFILE